jgi:hypothetical protein
VSAPRQIRVILSKDGTPIESYDAEKYSREFVRGRRLKLAKQYPERAPLAIGTYELRKAPGEVREVIRLAGKG